MRFEWKIESKIELFYTTDSVTPGFDPICIKNVYDVYVEINHGVELKEKAPPSI